MAFGDLSKVLVGAPRQGQPVRVIPPRQPRNVRPCRPHSSSVPVCLDDNHYVTCWSPRRLP